MSSRETPNYWKITEEECLEITRQHRETVLKIMRIFSDKLLESWREHDKDKENPENLNLYTRSLNNPWEKETKDEWKRVHNHNKAHHVEWFLECDNPKLQYLVEMVCDNVATAIARNAKYEDIFNVKIIPHDKSSKGEDTYLTRPIPFMLIECKKTWK